MFPLKVMTLAAACGFGAYFGWHGARIVVEFFDAMASGFMRGFRGEKF